MFMATPLAILFLVITAAWTGIFAIAFERQRPAKKRVLLADCFWIGVPSLCIVAAIALLVQTRSLHAVGPSHEEHAQASVAEHRQECIRDSQTQRFVAQDRTQMPDSDATVRFETATRPTLER